MIREILLSAYLWLKVLHIAAVIAWMAAMMYLPRIFIYHFQAEAGGEAERFFTVMERRLMKGIMTPALVVVWVAALMMLYANPELLTAGWFHVKLASVLTISGIHGVYIGAQRKFEAGERPRTEKFWRYINEAPFVLMLIVLIMVVIRPF